MNSGMLWCFAYVSFFKNSGFLTNPANGRFQLTADSREKGGEGQVGSAWAGAGILRRVEQRILETFSAATHHIFMLKNRWTGDYMHIENRRGRVELTKTLR